jgi:hypothetical protein
MVSKLRIRPPVTVSPFPQKKRKKGGELDFFLMPHLWGKQKKSERGMELEN